MESKDALENFISQYPNSSRKKDAQRKICELEGMELYKNKDLLGALKKFDQAGGRYGIALANQPAYDKCKEYYDYTNSHSVAQYISFLQKYPNSAYYNKVSNKVAISKAASLTIYSSKEYYDEALSYAKDKDTREAVERYIKKVKDSHREYKRTMRGNRIMVNGGYVQFGVNFDLLFHDYNDLSIGVGVKLGNNYSPVQFEVGAKAENSNKHFRLPVYSKLKVNLFGFDGYIGKFYLAGIATYNAVKEYSDDDFGVGGGVGLALKHFDWLILYSEFLHVYNKNLSGIDCHHLVNNFYYSFGNVLVGTSFTYYF